jgi:hypothetical protein
LKSSGIFSARSSSQAPAAPSLNSAAAPGRSSFALAGRSAKLDPRTHAVRGDLADLRLADRVFAPHYAAPMAVTLADDVVLREAAAADSAEVASLSAGDTFEVLELAGSNAWGLAPVQGLVGYILASAIGPQT